MSRVCKTRYCGSVGLQADVSGIDGSVAEVGNSSANADHYPHSPRCIKTVLEQVGNSSIALMELCK